MQHETQTDEEEIRGAYAEARVIKSSIIYKKNEVLQLLQDHHYYSGAGTYPSDLNLKITSNLITLYRLIRPMFDPKTPQKKYEEFKKKIKPVMEKLIKDKQYKIQDNELYEVVDDIIDFIHLVGITDLTIDDMKKSTGLASDEL